MNKLQINPPAGYEIDLDKSDLSKGIVHFKEVKRKLTYDEIYGKLFKYGSHFCTISGISKTEGEAESILALNKLCNVAKYLNGDWLPKFDDNQTNYIIYFNMRRLKLIGMQMSNSQPFTSNQKN